MHYVRGIWGAIKILWHFVVCPVARARARNKDLDVTHTEAGRIYECPCGYAVWEMYS